MLKILLKKHFGGDDDAPRLMVRLLTGDGFAHWRSYVLVLVSMAVTAGCTAAAAYLIGHAINEAYVQRSFGGIAVVAIAIIVVFAVKGISTYSQTVALARIGNHIGAENQRRMFDKLLRQNVSYFSDKHSSEFTARIAFCGGSAANVLRLLITTLGRDLMTLFALVAIMFVQAPLLSLIAFLGMLPSILIVRRLIARVRNITRTEFSGNARILKSLQETIQGLHVIKALNLEDEMRRRLDEDSRSVEEAANKLARVMNRSAPFMDTLAGLAVGLVLIYGSYQVLLLGAPPGQFTSFITAFLLAYEPGKRLAKLNVDLTSSLIGVRMLYEILDLPDRANINSLPDIDVVEGRLEFRGVNFEYRPDNPVLRGLSFTAEPGKITALVGPSGSGKTTIFALLLRFYDAAAGAVMIDGQDVTSVSSRSVRSSIAYVSQDIFLFHGSIGANIAFGQLGASEAEVIAAARAAHAHDFIMQLPQGYDTQVGERGLQLSGGQRQRIAVARALIRNAKIILLDEPTGSLDSETEFHVQQAIKRLVEGRTTLVIAHRLNTIRDADIIHVVENGVVVESGRHDYLIRRGQSYARVYRLQFEEKNELQKREAT